MLDEKDRENARRFLETMQFVLWKAKVREAKARANERGLLLVGVLIGLALAAQVFLVRILVDSFAR